MTPLLTVIAIVAALVCALYFGWFIFKTLWKALEVKRKEEKKL